jgi:hypothetical protein
MTDGTLEPSIFVAIVKTIATTFLKKIALHL